MVAKKTDHFAEVSALVPCEWCQNGIAGARVALTILSIDTYQLICSDCLKVLSKHMCAAKTECGAFRPRKSILQNSLGKKGKRR